MSEHNEPIKQRDDVATLVRLAGRSAVPAERMERARLTAKQEWQLEVGRRSRRRAFWAVAASAAVLAGVAVLLGLVRSQQDPLRVAAVVEAVAGRATISGALLTDGQEIAPESRLETGDVGTMALRAPSGHSVRADRDTQFEFRADGSIDLLSGALYISSEPGAESRALDVHTPFGFVEELGTQYELRLDDDALRVRLREGSVRLHHPDNAYLVEGGSELTLDRDGRSSTREISVFGEEWDWVTAIAPAPPIGGRSALDVLRWVAREKGWTLSFTDMDGMRAADETIMEGHLQRLSVDETLDAVLPASRLAYHVNAGTLVVTQIP